MRDPPKIPCLRKSNFQPRLCSDSRYRSPLRKQNPSPCRCPRKNRPPQGSSLSGLLEISLDSDQIALDWAGNLHSVNARPETPKPSELHSDSIFAYRSKRPLLPVGIIASTIVRVGEI